jgi:hypothetical protein
VIAKLEGLHTDKGMAGKSDKAGVALSAQLKASWTRPGYKVCSSPSERASTQKLTLAATAAATHIVDCHGLSNWFVSTIATRQMLN